MPVQEPLVTAKSQRRRKAPTLREHDWEPLKTRIVDLHVKMNMSLPDVRALMQKEQGFEATLRQYRSRISQWGLDKNIKTKEMNFIARKYHERQSSRKLGSTHTFRVRGKIVPPAKIRRWMERASSRRTDATEDGANTPSDVSYWSECDELESSDPPEVPETHRTICKRSETVPNKVEEEKDNDPVQNRLESIVRYRQSSSDSPVSSLRDLYRQQDLPSLLGSLEIDDVLVGPYVADAEADSTNGPGSAQHDFAPDLHTSVAGTLSEFEMTQRVAEDKAKETLTSLVRTFFEHAHPFVPVLDKQDFLHRWDEDRESIPLPIRSAIFSLAEALNDVPDNALKWFHLARVQLSPSLPAPDLSSLQALLILLKVKESMRKENYYYDSWLGISRCIQIAQDLRLSQHAAHHQRPNACNSSAAKCRLLRRIWQTIYVVEVMISYPKAYSALAVPVSTVDFSLGLNEADAHMAAPEEFQFTQLARLVRNIKELHSTYLVGKFNARLATETEFLRHKSTLESWLKSLPVELTVEQTSDEARPTLNSAFIGHLHSFFCLGTMMLNRIQLPLYDPHSANEQWLRHMLLCHAAAKEQCRLYEAIIHQYGLRGVQCMQRGANFTIYCLLLCVAVHLAALTSPDPMLHSDAADYLTRQMRLLESCQKLWPSPELTSQVTKLRELLSAGVAEAFGLNEASWSENSEAAAHAQGIVSNWLGPGDIDETDLNLWIDAFL